MISKQTETILEWLQNKEDWKLSLGYLLSKSNEILLSFNDEGFGEIKVIYKDLDITEKFSFEEKILIKSSVIDVGKWILDQEKSREEKVFHELGH